MHRLVALVSVLCLAVASCGGDAVPPAADGSDGASAGVEAVDAVEPTAATLAAYAERAVAADGGTEAFARTWWAVDRGYEVAQLLGTTVAADGTLAGVEPAGASLGLLTDPPQALAAPVGAVLADAAAPTAAQDRWVEAADRSLGELAEDARGAVDPEDGLDPELRNQAIVAAVVALLAVDYSASEIIEGLVLGEVPGGRTVSTDAYTQPFDVGEFVERLIEVHCNRVADGGPDLPAAAFTADNCGSEVGSSAGDGGGDAPTAPATSTATWIGELPFSPLGAFTAGTTGTNEVVVEVVDGVAQATVVYERLEVPVFTEAGDVLCVADVLFTLAFPALPVDDPSAFELVGRLEYVEGNRRGADCSRATPSAPGDVPATALFTASLESEVLASLELFAGGERVYEQPLELIAG